MEALHNNWFIEKHIDFEYKQYIMLGFLQTIAEEFEAHRMYPAFNILEAEYTNLFGLKQAFKVLENKLSKNIKSIDIQDYKIVYRSVFEDDKMIKDINAILDFALPKLKQLVIEGNKILNDVEQKIAISQVGISPLRLKEGYLFFNSVREHQIEVYSYKLTFYENSTINYPGIKTQFVGDYQTNIAYTYEHIKHDLIRLNASLPNPATYLVASALDIPMEFTFLPLAKRKLARLIN